MDVLQRDPKHGFIDSLKVTFALSSWCVRCNTNSPGTGGVSGGIRTDDSSRQPTVHSLERIICATRRPPMTVRSFWQPAFVQVRRKPAQKSVVVGFLDLEPSLQSSLYFHELAFNNYRSNSPAAACQAVATVASARESVRRSCPDNCNCTSRAIHGRGIATKQYQICIGFGPAAVFWPCHDFLHVVRLK
jgi:hypothetical protein